MSKRKAVFAKRAVCAVSRTLWQIIEVVKSLFGDRPWRETYKRNPTSITFTYLIINKDREGCSLPNLSKRGDPFHNGGSSTLSGHSQSRTIFVVSYERQTLNLEHDLRAAHHHASEVGSYKDARISGFTHWHEGWRCVKTKCEGKSGPMVGRLVEPGHEINASIRA